MESSSLTGQRFQMHLNRRKSTPFKFPCVSSCRYQDIHNQSYVMVVASGRWLGVRLDLLGSLLISAVSLAAVLVSQDAGRYILSAKSLQSPLIRNCLQLSTIPASWTQEF